MRDVKNMLREMKEYDFDDKIVKLNGKEVYLLRVNK